ncbi:hypothetical protein DV735_g610, partial [Chaetothyriales sp. CBS 134920]
NLIEERRNDPGTQQPFFWHHIRPEVRRRAIIETWQNARAGSVQRRLFDSGATVGEHAPNWVTLWLLYSVFRSRDEKMEEASLCSMILRGIFIGQYEAAAAAAV